MVPQSEDKCEATQPRLIQLFDKQTGNNLIWFDEESSAADAPVCKQYNF